MTADSVPDEAFELQMQDAVLLDFPAVGTAADTPYKHQTAINITSMVEIQIPAMVPSMG